MKTEFLQNFKVGEQPLPKEIIDAILAENGRDIEAAKKLRSGFSPFEGFLPSRNSACQGALTAIHRFCVAQSPLTNGKWAARPHSAVFHSSMPPSNITVSRPVSFSHAR